MTARVVSLCVLGAALAAATVAFAAAPAVTVGTPTRGVQLNVSVDQAATVSVVLRKAPDKPKLATGSLEFCSAREGAVTLKLTAAGRRLVERLKAASGASTAKVGGVVLVTAVNGAGERRRARARRTFRFPATGPLPVPAECPREATPPPPTYPPPTTTTTTTTPPPPPTTTPPSTTTPPAPPPTTRTPSPPLRLN